MIPVLAALLAHWRRHPFQLVAILVGLASATALWSGVQALNAQARAAYAEGEAFLGAGNRPRLLPAGPGPIAVADYAALRRAGHMVSPVIEGRLAVGEDRVRVLGIDPLTLPASAGAPEIAGGDGAAGGGIGAFLLPPFRALAAAETAAAIGGDGRLPPVDAARGIPPGTLVMDIRAARALLGVEGFTRLIVTGPAAGLEAAPALAAGRLVLALPDETADTSQLTASFHLNLSAFGLLSFVVGLFIVHAMIGLGFEARRGAMRSMRAAGVSARALALAVAAELVLMALAGGLLGMVLGYLLAAELLPDVAASLSGLYGASLPGELSLRPAWWVGGLLMCLAGTAAAGGQKLWQAARLPVLDQGRPEAWRLASGRARRWQAAAAVVLGLVAAGLAGWGHGLTAGFALVAALVVGAALALPPVVDALLAWAGRRARGPVAEWFWADSRQQLPSLGLALMALMLALAVNVGVGTMVASFRATFLDWLDLRLTSDLYVQARDNDEAMRVMAALEADPEVTAVLPIWKTDLAVSRWPLSLYGVRDHAYFREDFPLLAAAPGVWDAVYSGQGALISEQASRRLGLGLGELVAFPAPGGGRDYRVAGIYADYGNAGLQAIVRVGDLVAHWPDADRRRLGVRVAPGRADALATRLPAALGLNPGQITDQQALKAASREIFEKTFSVTLALNVLTLAVAAIALLTSQLSLARQRLPQLAPLWALGLTRARLGRIELVRALMLAALTAVLALPLGLALAWILSAVINAEAFGWRIPMGFYPLRWLALGLTALVTAVLAAGLPALALARMPPDRLLRVFADER